MHEIVSAVLSEDASPQDFAGLRLPESYLGAVLREEDVSMFEGMTSADKDPRKSLHVRDVPVPQPAAGEALVAVMASSVNYNLSLIHI